MRGGEVASQYRSTLKNKLKNICHRLHGIRFGASQKEQSDGANLQHPKTPLVNGVTHRTPRNITTITTSLLSLCTSAANATDNDTKSLVGAFARNFKIYVAKSLGMAIFLAYEITDSDNTQAIKLCFKLWRLYRHQT